jgi:hypothetical protein
MVRGGGDLFTKKGRVVAEKNLCWVRESNEEVYGP